MTQVSTFLCVIILFSISLLPAQAIQVTENQNTVNDSLLALIEARMTSEYGISYNSTLEQTANKLDLDINQLKQQLKLDKGNSKLDKMRLRQLGISVYQVLLAKESIQYGFNESSTLLDISKQFGLPVKKLKHMLGFDPNDPSFNGRTIQALNVSPDQILKAKKLFDETLPKTGNNIILVGMIVVFSALIVTSIIILQLKHLNAVTKDETPAGNISISKAGKLLGAHPEVTANDIVAVITSLQIYKKQIEERKQIMLTFHRNKANYWRAEGIYSMPNRYFRKSRP